MRVYRVWRDDAYLQCMMHLLQELQVLKLNSLNAARCWSCRQAWRSWRHSHRPRLDTAVICVDLQFARTKLREVCFHAVLTKQQLCGITG